MTHMLLLGKANNNRRSLWKLKQLNFPIFFWKLAWLVYFSSFLVAYFAQSGQTLPLFVVKQKATQKEKPWVHLIMISRNWKRSGNMILQIININKSKTKTKRNTFWPGVRKRGSKFPQLNCWGLELWHVSYHWRRNWKCSSLSIFTIIDIINNYVSTSKNQYQCQSQLIWTNVLKIKSLSECS